MGKKVPRLDDTARAFIGHSPFCLLATADAGGQCDVSPRVAIGICVRTVYIRCAKSFRRGRVWDPASWAELADAPDACALLVEQVDFDIDPAVIRQNLEAGYAKDLREERASAVESPRA